MWKWLDGKKRIIGILLVYIGKGFEQNPDWQLWGKVIEYIGLAISGGGVIHAVYKNKNSEVEK